MSLSSYIFISAEMEQKIEKIIRFFTQNQISLALAESCTGGLLSYLLTSQKGASRFFLGSVVCYSYYSKIQHLNISPKLLEEKGAVNSQICSLMLQGIKKKWNSHWALSITGVAGPEKEDKDPTIGTVFIGILDSSGEEKITQHFISSSHRQDIRQKASLFALDLLYSRLQAL